MSVELNHLLKTAAKGLISRREGELVEEKGKPLQFRQSRQEAAGRPLMNPVPHLVKQAESREQEIASAQSSHDSAIARLDQRSSSVQDVQRIIVRR